MTYAISVIAVAVIGGPVMWFLHRFDRRNTTQHEANTDKLDRIDQKLDRHEEKLDRLDQKLDTHLNDQRRHR